MKLNNLKISTRLILVLSTATTAAVIIAVSVIYLNLSRLSYNDAGIIGNTMSSYQGARFQTLVTQGFSKLNGIKLYLESYMDDRSMKISGKDMNRVLKNYMIQNPLTDAIYLCISPGIMGAGDSFVPIWTRNSKGIPEMKRFKDYDKSEGAYIKAKESGKPVLLDPYMAELNGNKTMITSLAVPLFKDKKFIGIIGIHFELYKIQKMFENVRLYESGFVNLAAPNGIVVASVKKDYVGKNINELVPDKKYIEGVVSGKKFNTEYTSTLNGLKYIVFGVPIAMGNGTGSTWCMSVNIPEGELYSDRNRTVDTLLIICLILISGISVIIYLIAKSISKQLARGVELAGWFAEGDFTKRIDDIDQKDEVGQLIKSLNKAGDDLEQLIGNVMGASMNLTQAVDQISRGNQNLSQRTSEQASALEEVASTIEENTATVDKNTENSKIAEKQAAEGADISTRGTGKAGEAMASINEINHQSKKIAEIINVINEIAFQTNLLALNAAVEAARAGEQGRGFAVVAGEVRNLAQRSGDASKEIEQLIKDSVFKVEQGTELVRETADALTEIESSSKSSARLMTEISAASEEQKAGMDQINTAILQLDAMTQQNAALVEETAAASEEMSNQAQDLISMIRVFKINGSGFSNNMKNSNIIEEKGYCEPESSITEDDSGILKKASFSETLGQDGFEEF